MNDELDSSSYDAGITQPRFKDNGKLDLSWTSIKDASHCLAVCNSTQAQNTGRARRCAWVQEHHDGAPPYNPNYLKKYNEDYRTNISTQLLAGTTARAVNQHIDAYQQLPYITNSSLPQFGYPGWMQKNTIFQEVTTRAFRGGWTGSAIHIQNLAQEDVLQGYAVTSHPDEYEWRPEFHKAENALFPDETPQAVDDIQVVCIKKDLLVHKFVGLWYDNPNASDNGWDLDNCREAASNAVRKNRLSEATTYDPRSFVDSIRDNALGITYGSRGGPLVVKTWYCFVREHDGTVSQWIISRNDSTDEGEDRDFAKHAADGYRNGDPAFSSTALAKNSRTEKKSKDEEDTTGRLLYKSIGKHKRMEDCISVFTYQPNSTIHGSMGFGRILGARTQLFEQTFCLLYDQCKFAGMIILQTDGKSRDKVANAIHGMWMVISNAWQVSPTSFPNTTNITQSALSLLSNNIEQTAGVYLTINPVDTAASRKSAEEAHHDAVRETSQMTWTLSRWLQCIFWSMRPIQLRLYHDDVIKEAVRILEKVPPQDHMSEVQRIADDNKIVDGVALRATYELLARGLTEDEIRLLRDNDPSLVTNQDVDDKKQGLGLVTQLFGSSKYVDALELTRRNIEMLVGREMRDAIMLQDNTAADSAEQIGRQQSELLSMIAGMNPPVSERDNHGIHLHVMVTEAKEASFTNVAANDKAIALAEAALKHFTAHLGFFASKAAGNPQQLQQAQAYAQMAAAGAQSIDAAKKQLATLKQIAKAQAGPRPVAPAMPVMPQGTPQPGQVLPPPVAPAPGAPLNALPGTPPSMPQVPDLRHIGPDHPMPADSLSAAQGQ